MKVFLISYASVAIVVPALWIGVRLWLRRHSQTPAPVFVGAQIIAFPIAMVASNRRRARPHWETNGQRLTRSQRWRLQIADQYVSGETTIPIPEITRRGDEHEVTDAF
jgi:hypothetical protein